MPAGTEQPLLGNLFVTLLQRMGLEDRTFANSNGDLNAALL